MKKNIKEESKTIILPNARQAIEARDDEKFAKKLVSSMSSSYEVSDFWKAGGALVFESKEYFTLEDYPDGQFKIYIIYSNLTHGISVRYKFKFEEGDEFCAGGHHWLKANGIKVGNALKLIKNTGFLPPSIENISKKNGDEIFNGIRYDLSKNIDNASDDDTEKSPNIIKMNIKENRNMKQKQTVKINENQLRQIVTESVKRMLNEGYFLDKDKYDFDYSPQHNKEIDTLSQAGEYDTSSGNLSKEMDEAPGIINDAMRLLSLLIPSKTGVPKSRVSNQIQSAIELLNKNKSTIVNAVLNSMTEFDRNANGALSSHIDKKITNRTWQFQKNTKQHT